MLMSTVYLVEILFCVDFEFRETQTSKNSDADHDQQLFLENLGGRQDQGKTLLVTE